LVDFNHLKKNKIGYFSHLKRAMLIGANMVFGGLFCLIHSIFPFIFHDVATNTVKKIYFTHIIGEKDEERSDVQQ
jgi:hypothetical protein